MLSPYQWGKHEVSYYSGAKRYSREVKAAVRAWNRSGVRFRWVPGPKHGADVTLRIGRLPRNVPGATHTLWQGRTGRIIHATIVLRPDNLLLLRSRREARYFATLAIAHELGHAMGLGHEVRGCATMNPAYPLLCPTPREPWRFHCRLLHADDVAGAIRRYGGRTGKLGPEVCDRSPRPKPATQLTVRRDEASGRPLVTWRDPGGEQLRHVLLRRRDACPRGAQDPKATLVDEDVARGAAQSLTDDAVPGAGHYCYAVVIVDGWEHPSRPATARFDQAGPPVAGFSWKADSGDARRIVFTDQSTDADGAIVAWRWDFGDGTSSDERNPAHAYPNGTYTVHLAVTDDRGQTDTITQQVVVGNTPTF